MTRTSAPPLPLTKWATKAENCIIVTNVDITTQLTHHEANLQETDKPKTNIAGISDESIIRYISLLYIHVNNKRHRGRIKLKQ